MTLLKRVLVVALAGFAIPALAQNDPNKPLPKPNHGDVVADINVGFQPRQPLPKRTFVRKPAGESRLVMKFTDAASARVMPDKTIAMGNAVARDQFDQIVGQYNLQFTSAFPGVTTEELRQLERRAAILTNRGQPDLAGMVYVDGPEAVLQTAANALLQLDDVEWIFFRPALRPTTQVPAPPAPTRGGLLDQPARGGQIDDGGIAGMTCDDCGDEVCADCFTPGLSPFCNDQECCDLVHDLRPFCEEVAWDPLCVQIAHLLCECAEPCFGGSGDMPPVADRCATFLNGSCYEEHSTGGCIEPVCCTLICTMDPFCCTGEWDEACVVLARNNCVEPDPGGPTPDLTALQGYLRRTSYEAQAGGTPAPLLPPAGTAFAAFFGYGGEGYYLFDDQYLTDHPGAPVPQRYSGIYGLGRQLLEEYGIGPYNMTRGRGIKVAVIEWAYYQGHEDLDVISEPGQTLIMIPDITFPDHATACLGIINAQINGLGMNGIAPDSQAYFFPLTSVEDGPRENAAWVRMMQTLAEGDVVSCSYGGGGNLTTNEDTWTLIRLASDLGITVCVAAGNACGNMDEQNDFGDSGGVVVGAGSPGRPHSRLTFSNYFQDSLNEVHVQGWGEAVPALGGSANVRFPGGNWNRSYCNNFNGTSAACPQIAGLVACLQGLAKQFYGIPLRSDQIRAALASTAFPQMGIPNPDALPGFDPVVGCGPDTDPDEGPNKIGGFPRPERAGAFILNQWSIGFNDSPLVDDLVVIRGVVRAGNKFSLKGRDNNFLVVDTQFTQRKHRPTGVPSPADRVTYLGAGEVADIMVLAHVDSITNNMQVNYEYVSPGGTSFLVTEMYDFTTRSWVTLAFDTVPAPAPGTLVLGSALATAAQRFINQAAGNRVYVRQYLLAIGGPSVPGNPATLTMRWDWIDLQVFQGFGGGGTGGGGPADGP